ncbi:MAG: aminotransferase class I/II-fold pyridoxal phosphate-dependent enzyme [Pirellulaceae bacterium]
MHILKSPEAAASSTCAPNNYLGLSDHPGLIQAAHAAVDRWGFGLSSVRFICGTQSIHKQLEQRLSEFAETEDTILYSSCFDRQRRAIRDAADRARCDHLG